MQLMNGKIYFFNIIFNLFNYTKIILISDANSFVEINEEYKLSKI